MSDGYDDVAADLERLMVVFVAEDDDFEGGLHGRDGKILGLLIIKD